MLSTVKKRSPLRLTIKKVKTIVWLSDYRVTVWGFCFDCGGYKDPVNLLSQTRAHRSGVQVKPEHTDQGSRPNQSTQIRGPGQTRAHKSGVQAEPDHADQVVCFGFWIIQNVTPSTECFSTSQGKGLRFSLLPGSRGVRSDGHGRDRGSFKTAEDAPLSSPRRQKTKTKDLIWKKPHILNTAPLRSILF